MMQKLIKHLKDNRIKYLFETLVVINGILIAFYLNNWGIKQHQRKSEIMLLREIRSDISSSLEDLVEDKMVMDSAYRSTLRVISYLDTAHQLTTNIQGDFSNLISFSFFFPKKA